jgi:hypothetical protein
MFLLFPQDSSSEVQNDIMAVGAYCVQAINLLKEPGDIQEIFSNTSLMCLMVVGACCVHVAES